MQNTMYAPDTMDNDMGMYNPRIGAGPRKVPGLKQIGLQYGVPDQVRHFSGAVNSTGPVGDYPQYTSPGTMGTPPSWTTREGGSIPGFTDEDFEWVDRTGQWDGWGSDGAIYAPEGAGTWKLKDDVRSRYGLGDNRNNWEYDYGTDKNGPRINQINVKTGKTDWDKIGFTKDASGRYVPTGVGTMSKDSNALNKALNTGLAAIVGGGLAANYFGLPGMFGGGGETAAAQAFPVSAPGAAQTTPLASLGSTGGAGASTVPGMSVAPGSTGLFGTAGAGGAMSVPVGSAAAEAAAGMAPSTIGMTGASATMPAIMDLVKQYGPQAAETIMKQMGGSGGQATGRGNSALSSLLNLIGGGVDAYHGNRFADELKAQAEAMRRQADPYLQRLNETYDNPNSYFNTPEFQALSKLEASKLVGSDAASGRLSNSIDRDKALQDFAAARMSDYRGGLRNAISSVYKPESVASLYGAGVRAEGQAFSPLMAGAAQGARQGGDVNSWIKDIKSVINGSKDVWDWLSKLWG